MCNSLWTTLKKIGINLPISLSNPLFHSSVHDYPIKKCIQFYQKPLWVSGSTSRLSKENMRKEEIYLSRTVLLLTFTFSLISELSLGFASMPVCYGVNGLFLFVWLVLFLMLSSAFILFTIILVCMHARCLFGKKILVIYPAIHSFVVHSLYHLSTFLSNLQTGHE